MKTETGSQREFGVARRRGGFGSLGLGRLGGGLRRGGRVALRLRVGRGGVELRAKVRGLGGDLLSRVLGARLVLVGLGGGEQLLGEGELGVGAALERFQLAHGRRRRRRLARRYGCGGLGLISRLGGVRRLARQRFGARRRGRQRIRVRHEQFWIGKRDRLRIVRRDDHAHADLRLAEQVLGKVIGHADAAVRGRIAGQRPAVQRDARPGDALHVRHPGIVIEIGVVVLVLLDDAEDPGRGLASLDAGRNRRAQNPAVGVVDRHLLALERHDRHDRLAGITRRRRLGGVRRICKLGRGVGGRGQLHQHSRGRKNYDGGKPPDRRSGSSHYESLCHGGFTWHFHFANNPLSTRSRWALK